MKTRENTAKVLEHIHTNGLDNSEWNIMTEETELSYYGIQCTKNMTLPPHIAVYHNKEDSIEDIFWLSDFAYYSPATETIIFIYLL